MSNALLFVLGTFVSLLVLGGMSLLVYGAILDGRYQAEQERERERARERSAGGQAQGGRGSAALR